MSEPPCNDCDEITLHDSATPSLKPTRAPTAMPVCSHSFSPILPADKASLPERNEEQPPASKAPSPDVEKKTTLCIATTVIRKRVRFAFWPEFQSTARMVAQRNAILSLNSLPDVKAVVFTTDSFWLRYCKKNGLECSDVYEFDRRRCMKYRTNYAGTPYFKSLIHRMEEMHSCYFYGYVNGDIVFHSNITAVLKGVISLIREKKLKERVFPIWGGLWKGARDGTENEHLRLQHALHLIERGGERPQHREGCDEGSSFPRGRFGECVWWR